MCAVLLDYFNNIIYTNSSLIKKETGNMNELEGYMEEGVSVGGGCFLRNIKGVEVREAASGNREEGTYISAPTRTPSPAAALGLKVLVREGGQVRDTGRQVGDAGHRVDAAEPSVLALLKVDAARGEDRWVLIKEVIRSEQEASSVSQSHCVGDVLSMGDVQEAGCNPGHQVLS